MSIDFSKITENEEVIKLLKERVEIEDKIFELDNMALVKYELQSLLDEKRKIPKHVNNLLIKKTKKDK
jgi:hypothetical protein